MSASRTIAGEEYEKMSANVQFKCKPSQKRRWSKLWGETTRDFSFNVRRILNAEADKVERIAP